MSQGFDESRKSRKRDPVDAPDEEYEFDWDQVEKALDAATFAAGSDEALSEFVTRLLQLLVPRGDRRIFPRSLGMRLLALAWVLNPGYFEGNPSIAELARRANVSHARLADYTGHYSRRLRWRNRAQRHAWNWLKRQRSTLGKKDMGDDR